MPARACTAAKASCQVQAASGRASDAVVVMDCIRDARINDGDISRFFAGVCFNLHLRCAWKHVLLRLLTHSNLAKLSGTNCGMAHETMRLGPRGLFVIERDHTLHHK